MSAPMSTFFDRHESKGIFYVVERQLIVEERPLRVLRDFGGGMILLSSGGCTWTGVCLF